MTGFNQGFTKPNRNAASWDADINANFTALEKGYVFPVTVGATSVVTGSIIDIASGYIANLYNGSTAERGPAAMCLQAGSPGNTVYCLQHGAVNSFTAYSGHLAPGVPFYPSIATPGWVTTSLSDASLYFLGRAFAEGAFTFAPYARNNQRISNTVSGIAHCASGTLGVFSFGMFVGAVGFNTQLRVRSNSCDNIRVTFYSNSARTTIIYDTAINSGNLGVRTIDMIDAAMWPYSMGLIAYPGFGKIHGEVQVLSSAATAINSQAFQVNFIGMRLV